MVILDEMIIDVRFPNDLLAFLAHRSDLNDVIRKQHSVTQLNQVATGCNAPVILFFSLANAKILPMATVLCHGA